jgi:hypothetical protein
MRAIFFCAEADSVMWRVDAVDLVRLCVVVVGWLAMVAAQTLTLVKIASEIKAAKGERFNIETP